MSDPNETAVDLDYQHDSEERPAQLRGRGQLRRGGEQLGRRGVQELEYVCVLDHGDGRADGDEPVRNFGCYQGNGPERELRVSLVAK